MLAYYRNHVIVVLSDTHLTAEISEQDSSVPLPTKVSATHEEGVEVCLERARTLVDLYIDGVG